MSFFEQQMNDNPYAGEQMAEEQQQTLTEQDIKESEAAVKTAQGDKLVRVPLTPSKDSLYTGTMFIGTPSQPVRVIFDTGSEHLAVASNLCKDCATKSYNMA